MIYQTTHTCSGEACLARIFHNLRLFAILLVALVALPIAAQQPGDPLAPQPGETITGIVGFEGATVYAGPDFAYRILGELPINGAVVVKGRRGDFFFRWDGRQWLEIDFDGGSGWVYGRLVRTSVPFNSIPPTGRQLPRNGNGRVPEEFDLSDNICESWVGPYRQSSSVLTPDNDIVVTFPTMPGANVYSVIVIAPSGQRTAFDSVDGSETIIDDDLRSPREYGTYTWRVAPYYTLEPNRRSYQQLCLLETGGTFERVRP